MVLGALRGGRLHAAARPLRPPGAAGRAARPRHVSGVLPRRPGRKARSPTPTCADTSSSLEFTTAEAFASGGSPLAKLQRRVRNTGEVVHLVSFVERPRRPALPDARRSREERRSRRVALDARGRETSRPLEAAALLALHAPEGGTLAGRLLLLDARGRIRRLGSPSPDEIDLMMRDTGLLVNMEGL